LVLMRLSPLSCFLFILQHGDLVKASTSILENYEKFRKITKRTKKFLKVLKVCSWQQQSTWTMSWVFHLEHVSQESRKFLIALYIWGHLKSWELNFNVLPNLKCFAARKLWCIWMTLRCREPFEMYRCSSKYI